MKRLGIIGVGGIAQAVVHGLCGAPAPEGDEAPPEIFLSPRGARTAAELAGRYPTVQVCSDNQDVVDRSELVMIAVRPEQRVEALGGVRVGDDRVVVNVMAGVATDDVRQVLATGAQIVRAMPLQAVRERRSVTVTWPSHPDVDALFDRLGGALPVAEEADFNVFSAVTGTMSTHFAYLATLIAWAGRQGIPARDADRFVRSLFQGVGRALADESRPLEGILDDHETPGGVNERIRLRWFESGGSEALGSELDALLGDLTPTSRPAAREPGEDGPGSAPG